MRENIIILDYENIENYENSENLFKQKERKILRVSRYALLHRPLIYAFCEQAHEHDSKDLCTLKRGLREEQKLGKRLRLSGLISHRYHGYHRNEDKNLENTLPHSMSHVLHTVLAAASA